MEGLFSDYFSLALFYLVFVIVYYGLRRLFPRAGVGEVTAWAVALAYFPILLGAVLFLLWLLTR